MSTIQIRIDEKTKSKAQKILQKMGLDMSSAIKLYFHQIIQEEGIPFPITTKKQAQQKKQKER